MYRIYVCVNMECVGLFLFRQVLTVVPHQHWMCQSAAQTALISVTMQLHQGCDGKTSALTFTFTFSLVW